jgi:hypothetical protein
MPFFPKASKQFPELAGPEENVEARDYYEYRSQQRHSVKRVQLQANPSFCPKKYFQPLFPSLAL